MILTVHGRSATPPFRTGPCPVPLVGGRKVCWPTVASPIPDGLHTPHRGFQVGYSDVLFLDKILLLLDRFDEDGDQLAVIHP